MCSHSKSKIFKRLLAGLLALFACGTAFAQNNYIQQCINLTVGTVVPPYTQSLEEYFSKPGKITGTVLIKQAIMEYNITSLDFYVHVGITNMETEQSVSTKYDFRPANPRAVILDPLPQTVQLQYSDLQAAMSEPNLEYSDLTKEGVRRDGLPAGTYRIFIRLFVRLGGWNTFENIATEYSPPFTIREIPPVVSQTVQVLPPYTKTLRDYFSVAKIRSTIAVAQYPTDNAQLFLHARIQKTDHSITIASDSHAEVNIRKTGAAYPPYTLTQTDINNLFRYPYAQGITMEELERSGLPDGIYELCFGIYDPTGRELGNFCSAPFTVGGMGVDLEIEPPIIIQPYDGSELPSGQTQTLQFTWTRPAGAPAGTRYRLKLIELLDPAANYRDMLRTDNYPAFFETTVDNIPTYLYTAANPSLNKDRYYAFVVQALAPLVAHTAPPEFKNDGYSEPALFSFKKDGLRIPDFIPTRPRPRREMAPPAEEGLAIFVPSCPDCSQGQNNLSVVMPSAGTDWQLMGHSLNPNLFSSGPNASSGAAAAYVHIPADAIAVNNARNFYLRWEDKSNALAKLQPREGEGIVYRLRVRDAADNRVVWEQDVWNNNSYEQTHGNLPFRDGGRYLLHIYAVRGTVAQQGFDIMKDKNGRPETIASSCECAFTFMKLPDIPDMEEYTVRGRLSYKFEHYPDKYPLTTTTATLTRYTKPVDGDGDNWLSTPNDDRHAVPVRINEDGSFEVTFHAYGDNGLIPDDPSIVHTKPLKLREFFVLELNSPYYRQRSSDRRKSPATIVNLSDKVIDMGEITYNVWSYALEVEVSKGYSKYGGNLTGSYRELTPQNVSGEVKRIMFGLDGYEDMPYYEGDIPASEPKFKYGKSHITDGKVTVRKGADGKEHTYVTFDRLICNFQSNDRYYIDISQELEVDGKKKEYKVNEFRGEDGYRYRPGSREMSMMLALPERSHFVVKEKATLIDDRPPRSSVKGKLVFADPSVDRNKTQSLPDTDVALVVTYLLKGKDGKQILMNYADLHQQINKNNTPELSWGSRDDQHRDFCDKLNKALPEAQNTVLATARTDAEGNFEFKDFAMIDSCMTRNAEAWGLTDCGLNGNAIVTRTVRLVINNSQKTRWLNPAEDIQIQPNHEMTYSRPFKALLNTYRLWIRPIGDPDDMTHGLGPDRILRDAEVRILRAKSYSGESSSVFLDEKRTVADNRGCLFSIPKHWSEFLDIQSAHGREYDVRYDALPNDLRIIVRTAEIGEFAFKEKSILYPLNYYKEEYKIRQNRYAEEKAAWDSFRDQHYAERFTDQQVAEMSGRPMPVMEKFEFCSKDFAIDVAYRDSYRFADEYKPSECTIKVRMIPERPVISGQVLDAENMSRSVENGEVRLRGRNIGYQGGEYLKVKRENWGGPWPGEEDKMDDMESVKIEGNYVYYARERGEEGLNTYAVLPVSEAKGKGYFAFTNLYPNFNYRKNLNSTKPGVVEEYREEYSKSDYQLSVKARGYTLAEFRQQGQDPVKNVGDKWFPAEPLKPKMGQQFHFPAILMGPDGWITGCVIDEEGYALEARAKTTRSLLKKTEFAPSGQSCPAKVREITVGGSPGSSKPTALKGQSVSVMGDLAENWFKVPAPSTYSDTLFVIPENSKYFSDTLLIPSMPEGEYNVGQVVLKEKKHRIRIVAIPNTTVLTHVPPGIPGLTVRLLDVAEAKTDGNGVAEFTFLNAASSFAYEIIPPDDSDYIAASGELSNSESKEMVTYYIMLKKGATVSGKVSSDGKPVPGAEVWVLNGNDKRLVKTDGEGRYTLRGIKPVRGVAGGRPRGSALGYNATVHCAPPDDNPDFNNLLGLDKKVRFQAMDGSATADFELEIFYGANIRSLHGFGITLTDVRPDGGDNYRITGTVKLDKAEGRFEVLESISQNPRFKELKVKTSAEKDEQGRPYLVAVGGSYGIGMKQMDVTLKAGEHKYSVALENGEDSFLKITGDGVTGGFIHSKARVKLQALRFSEANLSFDDDQFYLSETEDGKSSEGVTSFKSYLGRRESVVKAVMKAGSFLLHDRKGGPMHFKFIDFDAISPLKESRLGADGVITLKPDVWFLNPLFKGIRNDTIRLNLPEIKMTPTQVNRGGASLKELTIEFEKWKIVAKDCLVDASVGGIVSKNVILRTGSLDFPAKDLLINKELFHLGDFEVKRLPLGDVSSLDIEQGASFQFGMTTGFDRQWHVMLGITKDGGTSPVGRVKGLPGFGQDLVFQSIKLTSDGKQRLGFATNSEKIRLYDVVDFLPITINSYKDDFNIDGAIDYGIPRIASNINHKLIFKKGRLGKKIELTIGASDISFENVGTFKSLMSRKEDRQLISDGLAELHGTIEEPGHLEPLRVVVRKRRSSPGQYRIWMEREDPKKAQTMRLGGTAPGEPEFLVEKADMVILPETGDWDLLRLKLVPSATYGSQSGLGTSPLYFQLRGDLYTDTSLDLKNQQIKMVGTDRDPESGNNNMDGFMGFELVYDFPNQQFVGGMTISEKKVGGVKFSGDLHMVIGRPGFYFMGAGGFMLPSLGEIKGGMIFGYYNHSIPLDVWSRILTYSQRGEVPCAFTGNSFRGFYAMGAMASLPFIGKIDESEEVAGYGYQLLLECGAEAAVWGIFQPSKNQIGVSAMLFANMKAKASVPLLTIGLGASASIKGYAEMLFNSPYTATLGLCGELSATGCFKAGAGDFAISGSITKTAHAGIEASVNLSNPLGSPKVKGSFGWGSCGSAFGKANCPVVVKKEKLCD